MKKNCSKLAFIGGSGLYNVDGITLIKEHELETPFGKPSTNILEFSYGNDQRCFFLPRHGLNHQISPSEVNYRANIFALKMLGVDTIVSLSAVGSLKEEFAPTHFVLPDQFIDWTKGLRKRSFFEDGMVGHVSVAHPIEKGLQEFLKSCLDQTDVINHINGSYVCIEGPQFSSKAESEIYRSFKASVIGMTNVPESYLAKEAGIAYATVAMVTDYDCWKDSEVDLTEVMQTMKTNYENAQKLIKVILNDFEKTSLSFETANEYSVVTSEVLLTERHKNITSVLLS